MVRKILRYPDKILQEESRPVTDFMTVPELVADMLETMHSESGVGLAAIQVGVPLRVFVIGAQLSPDHQVFVNPRLASGSGISMDEEGCLSFRKIFVQVARKEKVQVSAQDATGKTFTINAEGFFARALQHEMDHLNGKLLTDYVGTFRRESIKKQLLRPGARD